MLKTQQTLNTKVKNKLKDAILLHFNSPVNTTNDALKLSDHIYKKTKKIVNYNTLRRLFNTVPTTTQPSLYTLDVLAEYVGQINWEGFCKSVFVNERLIMLDFNMISSIVKKIDFEKLTNLVALLNNEPDLYGFLRNVITIAYQKKDYEFFKKIFTLKIAFQSNDKNHTQIYYTVNLLGSYVSQSKPLQSIALSHYYNMPYNENYYVEHFVDLDNINGYYGKLLDKYIKHKTTDKQQALLFYNCMKFYGCYLRKDFAQYQKYLKQINAIVNYNGIYSIPIARKRVCQAIDSFHRIKQFPEKFKEQVISDLKLINFRFDFMVQTVEYITHIAQGLYWLKQYEFIHFLVEKYLYVQKLEETHFANARWNHLKIYYSVALFYSGNKTYAKEYLNSINDLLFETKQYKIIIKEYKLAQKIIFK